MRHGICGAAETKARHLHANADGDCRPAVMDRFIYRESQPSEKGWRAQAASTFTAHTFNSGIFETGSKAGFVRRLTAASRK